MKNRIASLFLVFALLMSLCNFAVARDNRITVQSGGAERFTDVPTDHWAYGYINQVVGSGLFNGKTPTTFEPSNAMTRSQFVMVMARMEGMSSLEGQYTVTRFPDVTPTRRAAGPIAWASADEQGFVRGFGDGTFKPDSPITRGQFAALIHRYIIAKRYTNLHVVDPIPAPFTDAGSVSSAFTEDVEYARVHGLLTGYSDGTVRASNPITRAAIAAILARFLDLVTESGYTPLLDGPIIDNGDSGDTDEPPTDVPTSYDGIRLNVTNAKHGTTSFVSVLRDGVQVASDDVQPGDVVTISHVPDSGYRAKITVKDSRGRTVDVTTNGNISTFVMPEDMPVTITLKYLSTSSGSSSSGSGGSSSSSGGGGGGSYTPVNPVTNNYYYLHANAVKNFTNVATENQSQFNVWLSKEQPTADNVATLTANEALALNWDDMTTHGAAFTFYAILQAPANTDVTTAYSVTVGGTALPATSVTEDTTSVPGYTVLTINATSTGTSIATATIATVTVTFTGPNEPGPGPQPTERHWTVTASDSNEFVFFALSETQPENPAALTENGTASVNLDVTNATTANPAKAYLTLTPRDGFKFGDDVLELTPADNTTVTRVYPVDDADSTETDAVRVYEISRSAFTAANTTTNISILMQLASGVGRTYAVTVVSRLADGTQLPTETVPLEATADLNPATYLNVVTVNVPFLTGYRGYHLRSIAVSGDTDNAAVTAERDEDNSSETGDVYTFTMPDQPVTVTVVYEANVNNNLTYDVNVNITGQGTVSLNVAGVNKTTDANTTYHVKLDNGAVIVTEGDDATGTTMTQADYAELYGNTDFTQSVYLTAAPIAARNYKFNSASYNGTAVTNFSDAQTFQVESGTALNVNVDFSQIHSYGYTMTVIGKGAVTSTFDEFEQAFTSGLPETHSSGLIVVDAAEATTTVNAVPTVAQGKSASDYETTIIATNADGEDEVYASGDEIPLVDGELTNIIVDMQEKDRQAMRFLVDATNGSVLVKSEGGRILAADNYSQENATTLLQDARSNGPQATVTVSNGYQWFYALENSVITLLPLIDDDDTSTKVKEIKVWWVNNGTEVNLSDVLSTKGFSFQVNRDGIYSQVTFGAFNSYSVEFRAPYPEGEADMHSQSTNIANVDYLDATVRDVLYSLNNGQRATLTNNGGVTTNGLGISNTFTVPNILNKTVAYYLRNPLVNGDDGQKITGAENVKNMLEDSIGSSISTVFPTVVEAKKAALKADPSTVTGPIATEMQSAQTNNPATAR
ncbi:MAG: S-layer homology domain-containing protein [Oscillibacter sp.]|nr:S-layer homology domain-containing protein [Oscillibacter sp.]